MRTVSTSTGSATPLVHSDPALSVRLQTTVPSKIRRRSAESPRSTSVSRASTLRGLQNKRQPTMDQEPRLPDGWTKRRHPDSGVYYVHEDKRVSTSSDLSIPKIGAQIVDGVEALQQSLAFRSLVQDHEVVDLVLDVQPNTTATYYCVSHAERRIFWLEDIGHEEVDIPCPSNKCLEPMGSRVHCIEGQYWKHCELFPTTFTVTKEVTGYLKDVLLQAAADRLLVKFSTSPFDKQELEYMLGLVKEIEADLRDGSGHGAWVIARFMALYNDGVLQSSYGQSDDDYFDIEDMRPAIGPYQRHTLLAILGPLFLRSPDVYAVELHSFHENFTLARWSNFVHKVDQSIRDSNLLATVLLSTNTGFLGWSDSGRTGGINNPTAAQIMSYISIICSVGSIIVGLAIFKQYRAKGADTPLRAVVVLRRILKEPLGLERLAIICSLPYVLLMWSLIAFLAAFAIIFYEKTGIQVRIPISLTLFFVALSLFFCMYTAGPPDKENQKASKRLRKEVDEEKVDATV